MSVVELDPKVARFIERNIDLIEQRKWDAVYSQEKIPIGFTEAMLAADINPLHQGLNYIPNNFLYRSSIKSFTIPDHIESIGNKAFQECESLTSVIIGNSVTTIWNYAFANCPKLKEIKINQTVQQVKGNLRLHVEKEWRAGSDIQKIICIDGEIDLT